MDPEDRFLLMYDACSRMQVLREAQMTPDARSYEKKCAEEANKKAKRRQERKVTPRYPADEEYARQHPPPSTRCTPCASCTSTATAGFSWA